MLVWCILRKHGQEAWKAPSSPQRPLSCPLCALVVFPCRGRDSNVCGAYAKHSAASARLMRVYLLTHGTDGPWHSTILLFSLPTGMLFWIQ